MDKENLLSREIHKKKQLLQTILIIINQIICHKTVTYPLGTKALSYHHSLRSWDNDSMKQRPWIANLIAVQEWNHELSEEVTKNSGSLQNRDSNNVMVHYSKWKVWKKDEILLLFLP